MNNQHFYRAFEDRYRGSRELIKQRLTAYLPFINALKQANGQNATALDIGCGRGEWLELLTEQGLNAKGIDLDQGMLQACYQQGLNVEHANGITRLAELESNTLDIISAFHVVEHLTFEDLQTLITQAHRVLTPGGLLILETPNPENLAVAAYSFYMDPTHIKPIPPDLLAFTTEYAGFIQNKILRLQQPNDAHEQTNLYCVIHSVSPDYAVVAQKLADTPKLRHFINAFKQEYGISLNQMLHKYDQQTHSLQHTATQAEAKATQAEAKVTQAEARLNALLNSKSWTWTQPIRNAKHWLSTKLHWFKQGAYAWLTLSPHSRPRRIFKRRFWQTVEYIRARPKLKSTLVRLLEKMPSIRNKLARMLINQRAQEQGLKHKHIQLSMHAQNIFQQLENLKTEPTNPGEK
jgi:O-antigen chain-terminating methyltransferase